MPDEHPPATERLEDIENETKRDKDKSERSPFSELPTELWLEIWELVYSEYGSTYALQYVNLIESITNIGTATTIIGIPMEAVTTRESWDIATSHYFLYKEGLYVNVKGSTIEYTPSRPLPLLSPLSSLLAAARNWACNFVLTSYNFNKEELEKHIDTPHGFADFYDRVSAWAWPAVRVYMSCIVQQYEQLEDPQTETLELFFSQCYYGENYDLGCHHPQNPRPGTVTGFQKWRDQERKLREWEDGIKTRGKAARLTMTSQRDCCLQEARRRIYKLVVEPVRVLEVDPFACDTSSYRGTVEALD